MNRRILLVDDDSNILQGYRRLLRQHFEVNVALGPEVALGMIAQEEPYAVVVSDLKMPEMDGIEFLKRVTELSPNSVRIMLSGNADRQAVMDSVNCGQVFRFLAKPCDQPTLAQTLELAISHYQLIISEHELLTQTLTGSMQVLTRILSIVNPRAFGRTAKVRRLVAQVAYRMKVRDAWECEIAAMLSMIGTLSVPDEVLAKVERREPLDAAQQALYRRHPEVGESLVSHIPRLRNVARCIKYQNKDYDGGGFPGDDVAGDQIPIGARILRVVSDYEMSMEHGLSPERAFAMIQDHEDSYDLQVVSALEEVLDLQSRVVIKEVTMRSMPDQCVLAQDVLTRDGMLLVQAGQEIDPAMKTRLLHHAKTTGIREPIKVLVPAPPLLSPAGTP